MPSSRNRQRQVPARGVDGRRLDQRVSLFHRSDDLAARAAARRDPQSAAALRDTGDCRARLPDPAGARGRESRRRRGLSARAAAAAALPARSPVALGRGSWCPFNSQNTAWWPDAFPLLYLPSFCSFRMTDIWRSLVAQRIAAENGWWILFHEPTVRQERNEHNLMRTSRTRCRVTCTTARIRSALDGLPLRPGREQRVRQSAPLLRCARRSRRGRRAKNWRLLDAWRQDLQTVDALVSASLRCD